jgi:hypothetical protein
MPPEALAVMVATAALFLGPFVYRGFFSDEAKIRRALKQAPRVDIKDAPSGSVVKLVGRVRAVREPLRSPLGGRACVFFETTVERYHSQRRGGDWRQIIHETDSTNFLLEDGTGRALVRAAGMKVLSVKDVERASGFLNDAAPDLEAYLARHGHQSQGLIFNKALRFREGVFEPGELVAVIGAVQWERDPDPTEAGSGYRNSPKRLVVGRRPDGPLLASDEPEMV